MPPCGALRPGASAMRTITALPPMRSPAELLTARTKYPAYWWTPVATNGAPSWEILPQEARPGEVILSKRNELGLLSNFAATPFAFAASATPVWNAFGK